MVAVDRFGADHDRPGRHSAGSRDADVEDGAVRPESEGAGRRGRGLDRPDPADEPVAAVQLPVGRRDEKDVDIADPRRRPQAEDRMARRLRDPIGLRRGGRDVGKRDR